jgi:hypothetical protein
LLDPLGATASAPVSTAVDKDEVRDRVQTVVEGVPFQGVSAAASTLAVAQYPSHILTALATVAMFPALASAHLLLMQAVR